MNSEFFIKLVELKLVILFERLYPGKKPILVADDTLYHHKRVIGSLGSLNKKKLVELMKTHKVQYIDLPLTTSSCIDLSGRARGSS